jgi:hypothetical protein
MNVLICSVNLIGDTLCQIPALKAFKRAHPEHFVTWLLHANPSMQLFAGAQHTGAVDEVMFFKDIDDPGNSDRVSHPDFPGFDRSMVLECRAAWNLSLGSGEHLAQGYGRILGVTVQRSEILPEVFVDCSIAEHELPNDRTLAVSVRSASNDPNHGDGFSGNKNFPIKGWLELFKRLGDKYEPTILYGPEDFAHEEFAHLPSRRLPIRQLAVFLRNCKQYAGVDNGITHLAAALRVPKMFVIYPQCLPIEWVGYSDFPFYHAARVHPLHGDVDRVWREWRDHV